MTERTDNRDLEGLQIYQLFDLMEPLEPAEPVSMMPQGPGWWLLLAGLILTVTLVVARYGYRRYHNRYRRDAIEKITALEGAFSPLAVSEILKRCVLTHSPRNQVASLTGEQWCQFLNERVDHAVTFTDFYTLRHDPQLDRDALKRRAIYWLKHYRVTP